MDGNKDEGVKCFNLAKNYYNLGNNDKALKFLVKAKKLYPMDEHAGQFNSLELLW